jgi:uncharacterized Zn-finger protein
MAHLKILNFTFQNMTTLGILSETSDKFMCPGSTQPLEMRTRIFLGVKAAGA